MNTSRRQSADQTEYGDRTRWRVISREEKADVELLKSSQICSNLGQFNIHHVGIMKALPPFEVFRVHQSGTFMLACVSGAGEVLINGKWKEISTGQACLLPPFVTNAFRAKSNEVWEFSWVRYMEEEDKKTIANTEYPVLGSHNSTALKNAILGLEDELNQSPSKYIVPAWVNLIHQHVLKFAKPAKIDPRLITTLHTISQNLSQDWTLVELADLAGLSQEHLRRISNQQLGRSPMQQLTFMRMMHAKNLLYHADLSLTEIAQAVGYDTQSSFSNTFLKWIGCRPSELR